MRIALLVGRLTLGGAELAMLDLARGLAARGHSVVLFTLFDHDDAASLLEGVVGVRYRPLAGKHRRGVAAVGAQLVAGIVRLRAACLRESFDVLYSALNIANLIAALAVPRACRLVWSFHAAGLAPSIEDRVAAFGCRALAGRAAAAVAVSEPARAAFLAYGVRPRRFWVIGNGTDTDALAPDRPSGDVQREQWGIAPDVPVVGVVARIAPVKAPERWLRAIAALRARDPRVQGVWVGSGGRDYVAELRRQAAVLNVADAVHFVGPSRALRAVYNAFDVFLLLSLREGFAKVVAEAMAVARPCVVDRHAGAETLGDAGAIVDGDDAEAVASAVLGYLGDAGTARMAGLRGRQRCEQELSLQRTLDRTETLLGQLVGNGPQ